MKKLLQSVFLALLCAALLAGCFARERARHSSDGRWDRFIPRGDSYVDTPYQVGARYLVTANILDLEAVGSFPQQIESVSREGPDGYELIVQVQEPDYYSLPDIPYAPYSGDEPEIVKYLQATEYIQLDAELLASIAETLVTPGATLMRTAQQAAIWTAQSLQYDHEFAKTVEAGGPGRRVDEILAAGGGSCVEFSRAATALMRYLGIPARMVSGFWVDYGSGEAAYHCWAEFYLPGFGWVPVEPQTGFFGQVPGAVKLFVLVDYIFQPVFMDDIGAWYEVL